ncbi:hypothetical protein K9M41_00200 [Candidatus Gracilibacteria bacterium]|nr:hypothetical protein [Candidatus Gracilibacteria bacterium]
MAKVLPISERGQFTIPKKFREKFKDPYIICDEQEGRICFWLSSPQLVKSDVPEDSEGKVSPEVVKELDEAITEYEESGRSFSLEEVMKESKNL